MREEDAASPQLNQPHLQHLRRLMAEAKRRLLLILSDEECLDYFDAAFCSQT